MFKDPSNKVQRSALVAGYEAIETLMKQVLHLVNYNRLHGLDSNLIEIELEGFVLYRPMGQNCDVDFVCGWHANALVLGTGSFIYKIHHSYVDETIRSIEW